MKPSIGPRLLRRFKANSPGSSPLSHIAPVENAKWDSTLKTRYSAAYIAAYYSGHPRLLKALKKVESQLIESMAHQPLGRELSVPVLHIDTLSPEALIGLQSRFADFQQPIVIKGLGPHLTAAQKWTPDFLAENFGDYKVTVRIDTSTYTQTANQRTVKLPLREVVELVKKGDDDHYASTLSDVFNHNETLRDDLDLSRISKALMGRGADFFYSTELFFGGGSTRTAYHAAPSQNIFFNVYGKKTWTMVSPHDTLAMSPEVGNHALVFQSPVEPKLSTAEAAEAGFPLYGYANHFKVTLEPGDLLLSPEYWWHTVQNHGPTIGVANRFNAVKGVSKAHAWVRNMPRLAASNPTFFALFALSGSARDLQKSIGKTGWSSDTSVTEFFRT